MPSQSNRGAVEKRSLLYLLPLLRAHWSRILLALLAMVGDSVLTVMRPWPLKVVIDRVLSHRPSRAPLIHAWLDNSPLTPMQILYGSCAAVLCIALITGLLTYCYTHLLGVILFGSNALLLTSMAALMIWLNWRFALASLSIAPLMFWMVYRHKLLIKRATRKARASTGLLASLAQETLASIRIVQGLAQEDQIDERFQVQSESSLQAFLESMRYQAQIAPVVDFCSAIGLTMVMWYGARSVLAGHITTGDVVIFFAYVNNFYSPMKAITRSTNTFTKASIGAERIVEVLQHRSDVRDRKRARPAPKFKGAIEFRDVSFEYEPGVPVLSHVNLSIAPGQKLAIVGATGAGKSTLVSLVLRFYDPTAGAVLVDGEDIRNYSLHSFREQISLVLQDSLLLSGTIRDNISFGRTGATDEEIRAAAATANADEFIRRFPEGYHFIRRAEATHRHCPRHIARHAHFDSR